jgi:hypothetical protein
MRDLLLLAILLLFAQNPGPSVTGANATNVPPLPLPAGRWLLDEGTTATTALDSSGNGNNGTWHGTQSCIGSYYQAAILAPLLFGGCFDGSTNYIDLGDSATIEITGSITISAWIYLGTSSAVRVVSNLSGGPTYNGFEIFVNGNVPYFQVANGGTLKAAHANAGIGAAWVFVTATYDGTTGIIYINGTAQTTTFSGASAIGSSAEHVMIGEFPGSPSGTYWNHYLEDVRIFNVAYTPTQVAQLYTNGPGG